jgi:hypothetical protein
MNGLSTLILALLLQLQSPQANPAPQTSSTPPQEMSLAERAAAARKAAAARHHASTDNDGPPELTPEQRGIVRDGQYVNDLLQFHLNFSPEWQPFSDDRMARDEAIGRLYINSSSRSSPYRVLWIGDNRGRNVTLSVVPAPPDLPPELDGVASKVKQVSRTQLARVENLEEETEPVLLGNAQHKFAAFRFKFNVQDHNIVQSSQLMRTNGFLVWFVLTGSSDQDVTDALQSLKSKLAWSTATP